MQVTLSEVELKNAVEFYLLSQYHLTVQSNNIQFKSKQDKAVNLNGAVVSVTKEGE